MTRLHPGGEKQSDKKNPLLPAREHGKAVKGSQKYSFGLAALAQRSSSSCELRIHVRDVNEPGKASKVQTFELTQPARKAGTTIIPDERDFSVPINLQGMATFVKS
ncbi:hypothetical protein CVT26_010081 [Gymnopilus dilepis]|uniref:Uncharacterized protein n=1 Tax=Gymnopilus dilepis TaxID=231916 RepID=A0A409WTH6_9AGAR|nr:hypothetical protein CVT26_010081 [Gymnopilus dilepis]